MALTAKITITGLTEVLEKLAAAGKDVDTAIAEALDASAQLVIDDMKARVPKDTGNLASKLVRSAVMRDGNYHYVYCGLYKPDKKTAIYGAVQEYGSKHVPARPFIRPAFDKNKRRIAQLQMDIVKKHLEE